MSTALLKIKHKYREINMTNILGLKSRLPYFGRNRTDISEEPSLYYAQIVSRVDNSNMYIIHYDDGDKGKLTFEDIKKYIKIKETNDIFYIDSKENKGKVKGQINTSIDISKNIFLENNNNLIHFGENVNIIYKFENTPYISHLNLIFGSSNNNNIEVSILKVMGDMILENVTTVKINTDQPIECNSYVSWIKISISARTKLKNINIFYCKFRNKVIGNYDNIFTKENQVMIPTKNEDLCDLYITHKEIKSLESEYIPIEKHFLKVCGISNPLLSAYNFALKNDKMYKGKPYIRILCEKEVLPIFVSLMTGTFKIPKKIKYLIDIYNDEDIIADNTGDINHEITIPETPPIYGNVSFSTYQITQSVPLIAIVIPIIPPIQECVVDTGISKYDAVNNQDATEKHTHIEPYINV